MFNTKYQKYCELSVGLKLDKLSRANYQKASLIVLIKRNIQYSTCILYLLLQGKNSFHKLYFCIKKDYLISSNLYIYYFK